MVMAYKYHNNNIHFNYHKENHLSMRTFVYSIKCSVSAACMFSVRYTCMHMLETAQRYKPLHHNSRVIRKVVFLVRIFTPTAIHQSQSSLYCSYPNTFYFGHSHVH